MVYPYNFKGSFEVSWLGCIVTWMSMQYAYFCSRVVELADYWSDRCLSTPISPDSSLQTTF